MHTIVSQPNDVQQTDLCLILGQIITVRVMLNLKNIGECKDISIFKKK